MLMLKNLVGREEIGVNNRNMPMIHEWRTWMISGIHFRIESVVTLLRLTVTLVMIVDHTDIIE